MTLSPLAPASFPELATIDGVTLSTAASAMKYQGRDDMLLMRLLKVNTQISHEIHRVMSCEGTRCLK